VVLRELHERLVYLRNLEQRKEEVIRIIEEQEKLTAELKEEILKAEVLQRVEDLYKPFRQKKSTRASKAKEKAGAAAWSFGHRRLNRYAGRAGSPLCGRR
jgi:uncharacterized protein